MVWFTDGHLFGLVKTQLLHAEFSVFGLIEDVSSKNNCWLTNLGIFRLSHCNQVKQQLLVCTNSLQIDSNMLCTANARRNWNEQNRNSADKPNWLDFACRYEAGPFLKNNCTKWSSLVWILGEKKCLGMELKSAVWNLNCFDLWRSWLDCSSLDNPLLSPVHSQCFSFTISRIYKCTGFLVRISDIQ